MFVNKGVGLTPMRKFGKYVLVKKIANGGMAEIYRAKYYGERGFAKDVAIKMILPNWSENKSFERMLVDEANALVHLQHQNIVQVFELGRDGKCYYISMEYVDGVDLRQVSKQFESEGNHLPEKFVCFIIAEVLKALEFAHRQRGDGGEFLDIVHRDVSPQNILISYNGEVKLTDFGIAKGMHREEETTTNQLKGKYAYMSPEQAGGEKVDHRSDLYSTGIVLYELLTAKRLFGSANDFETLQNVREVRFPGAWWVGVSLNMRKILERALAKDVNKRYQTAAEFLKDLNGYISFRKLHTHGLELSDYLHQLFADRLDLEGTDEKVEKPPGTKVLASLSKVDDGGAVPWRRYVTLVVLFVFLLASGVVESVNSAINRRPYKQGEVEKVLDGGVEKVKVAPGMPSIGMGVVNIDSEPQGASGILEYNGVKKDFTTPFVIADIDVAGAIEAKIRLNREGFVPVADSFVLNKATPSFAKTYALESAAPARISVHARPWGYVYIPGVVDKKESPVNGVNVKPGRHKIKVYYSPTNTWASADLDIMAGQSRRCLADFTNGGEMRCK